MPNGHSLILRCSASVSANHHVVCYLPLIRCLVYKQRTAILTLAPDKSGTSRCLLHTNAKVRDIGGFAGHWKVLHDFSMKIQRCTEECMSAALTVATLWLIQTEWPWMAVYEVLSSVCPCTILVCVLP